MPDLGLNGPYRLDPETVNQLVKRASPGNFAVGYRKEDRGFVVRYVGRSDSDLKQTLHEQQTDGSTWFKWDYAESAHSAFDHECRNYHDFGESVRLENEKHPEPPKDSKWRCPVCNRK